jgi:hypothetical protein
MSNATLHGTFKAAKRETKPVASKGSTKAAPVVTHSIKVSDEIEIIEAVRDVVGRHPHGVLREVPRQAAYHELVDYRPDDKTGTKLLHYPCPAWRLVTCQHH